MWALIAEKSWKVLPRNMLVLQGKGLGAHSKWCGIVQKLLGKGEFVQI